jgi:imidazolonepropionase-like amidohydrolase
MKTFFLAVALLVFYAPISSAQERPVYLTGGHLVDVVRGEIYEDIGVVIEADKITGLFFDFPYNAHRIPENAQRVDVTGKYLIPGLTDLHVHTPSSVHGVEVDKEHYYRLLLKSGITTIRALATDSGAPEPSAMSGSLKDKLAIDDGDMDGPNIIVSATGLIEQAPGFPRVKRTQIVNNTVEARELVSDYAYRGAEWIKFYNYGDEEMVRAIIDEAHRHGRKVWGHFAMLGAAEASRLGVDSLEHTVAILQSALDYETSISMTDIGYYRMFRLWTEVNEEKVLKTFEVLVENETPVIPTLAVQKIFVDRDKLARDNADFFRYYQPEVYEALSAPAAHGVEEHTGGFDFAKYDPKQWGESIKVQARLMAKFVEMGGIVGAGSDSSIDIFPYAPGVSLHQELQAFVEGGMTPLEALRTATTNAAKILGWENRFGSIEIGKQADIVVLNANPLVDIKSVGDIHTIVKSGEVFPISDLNNQLLGSGQ